MDKILNIKPTKSVSNKSKRNLLNNENRFEKSVSAFNPKPKMEDVETDDLMEKMKQIAVTAFNNAAKESVELFLPEDVSNKIKLTKKSGAILSKKTIIAIHQAFQNEFTNSLNSGFPMEMLINDTIIKLNPDNTYEVTSIKRELNTIRKIYLK